MATASTVREHLGHEIPAAGTYDLDVAHTSVEFVARHLMITKVRGRFTSFRGEIHVADVPEDSSVAVEIDAGSISTAEEQRDAHLRSPDFLDVERYPLITFRSTSVQPHDDGRWSVTGDLTIRDVTRPVVLEVTFDGATVTPWGDERVGFSASTEIDREDWGLTWNQALETGGVLVGKKVRIELSVEATRRS